MQKRTAPPLSCYFWHFIWEPEPFFNKTSGVVICKRENSSYRIIKSCNVAWLYGIMFAGGLAASFLLTLPKLYNALLLFCTLLLGFGLPALYSYYRTEFEKLPHDASRDR